MINTWGISKVLIWNKFKLINLILFFSIVETIIVGFLSYHSQANYLTKVMIVSTTLIYILGMILLTCSNENILFSNRYRLIPISDLKLYFINLVTTILIYLYFSLLEAGIFMITFSYQIRNNIIERTHLYDTYIYDKEQLNLLIKDLIVIILAVILIWTICTFIHLIMNSDKNIFLKGKSLKKIIFKISIVVLGLLISFWTLTRMSLMGMYRYTGIADKTFFQVCLLYVTGIILSIIMSIYFLKNKSETVA